MAQIGSFEYNIGNNTIIWSDKLYQMYGQSKKTFQPTKEKFFNNIVHPEHKQQVMKEVEEGLEKKAKQLDYFHKIITEMLIYIYNIQLQIIHNPPLKLCIFVVA